MTNYTFKKWPKKHGYVIVRGGKPVAPGNVARIMNSKFTNMFKSLNWNPHSVIMYRRPKNVSEEDFNKWLDDFSDELQARMGIHHGINISVDRFSDIKVLSEEDLEAMGLIRADKVLDMMKKAVDETLEAQAKLEAALDEEE